MSTLIKDLRYALRTVRLSPGFAAVAIATVALAIGANTAIFSFVKAALLDPLPYPDADRIVRVLERRPDGGTNGISTLNYLDWAEQNTVFEYLAAQAGWGPTLTGGDEPIRLRGTRASADFFKITGTLPALGRTFLPGEDQVGADHIVVLSHRFWVNRFGADPAIVGSDIMLDGELYTVVGVLPEGGTFDRSAAQIYKPLAFEPANMTRDFHWFGAMGKIKAGITLEQAQAAMDVIGGRIAEEFPDSNKGWSVAVTPLAQTIVGSTQRTAVIVLFAATGFVVLIGCANLASLALARGVSREREIAVRAALGAGRWRLARQFLTENVVIAFGGGIVGIGVGFGMMKWIQSLIPPFSLPAEVDVRMDASVMLFALGAAIVTGLLFGMAPALQATNTNLSSSMKEGGHGSTPGSAGRRLRATLVVAEIGLAFVLLTGSGLLMRSLFSLLDVDPGFDAENVLTAGLPITPERHPDPVELNAYLDSIRRAVEAVPEVTETAMTSALPLQGWGYGMPYLVAGRETVDRAHRRAGFFKMVTPGYFEALRIRLLAGRFLTEADRAGGAPVMLINETFAKREFPDEDPIGQRILVQEIVPGKTELGPEIAWEIVGVIADEKIGGLADDTSGGMYVSNRQSPVYGVSLLARSTLDPESLIRTVRATVDTVDKNQALSQVRTLEQIQSQSLTTNRIESILFGLFAGMALALAAVGIYGVISYGVAQRSHEMGIRAALGASAGNLQRLVFRGGMKLTLIGLAVGLIASLALTRVMASLLFGVSARDAVTLGTVAVVLTLVAAAACFIPARRVTRLDPNVALRYQ
jgi:putative ABC transport system permease protein